MTHHPESPQGISVAHQGLNPNPPPKKSVGSIWLMLILGALVLILLLIFILQNGAYAEFSYFGWEFSLPLGIAVLFATVAGMLLMAFFGSIRLFTLTRRLRKAEHQLQATPPPSPFPTDSP